MQQLDSDVAFIGVAGQDSVENMQGFVDQYGLQDMAQVADVDGSLSATHFQILGHSSWIFIDGDTGEVTRHVGALARDDLESRIQALIA